MKRSSSETENAHDFWKQVEDRRRLLLEKQEQAKAEDRKKRAKELNSELQKQIHQKNLHQYNEYMQIIQDREEINTIAGKFEHEMKNYQAARRNANIILANMYQSEAQEKESKSRMNKLQIKTEENLQANKRYN